MKTRFFIAVAMLCLVSFSASAQDGNNRRQRFDRAEMIQRYADRLAQQMNLSEENSSAFKVLFMDYQMARQNAANPKGENEQESIDMQKLTDEQAGELVQKHFAAQEAQLKVDKEYYPKFLEILTPWVSVAETVAETVADAKVVVTETSVADSNSQIQNNDGDF